MNKKGRTIGVILISIVFALFIYFIVIERPGMIPRVDTYLNSTNTTNAPLNQNSIKIANWNLQIFGDSKASNSTLMSFYVNKITNYDIIFIQEIRDADGSSFDSLCGMLSNYKCSISSRAGRSSSKEQYGVIYKKEMIIEEVKDYNPDVEDRWERPPIRIKVYNMSIYNIHIKPENVKEELYYLEQLIPKETNTIVLGDFNMDCSYYNTESNSEFDTWTPTVPDTSDTTVSSNECAYDRLFYYDTHIINSGIDRESITKDISDHYLIWAEISNI